MYRYRLCMESLALHPLAWVSNFAGCAHKFDFHHQNTQPGIVLLVLQSDRHRGLDRATHRIWEGAAVLACSIDRLQVHQMAGIVGVAFRLVVLLILLLPADGQNELDGTLLFLHVWKCGGTTLRQLMCDWADREGLPCATVGGCRSLSLEVCM